MAKNTAFAREGYLRENYHYFHLRDTAGQERDFHFHEFDKIVLLLSGRVDYFVESEVYALEPWSLLLVKHHTIHKALIDKSEPYERVIIYLDRKYFERIFPDAGIMDSFDAADRLGRHYKPLLPHISMDGHAGLSLEKPHKMIFTQKNLLGKRINAQLPA